MVTPRKKTPKATITDKIKSAITLFSPNSNSRNEGVIEVEMMPDLSHLNQGLAPTLPGLVRVFDNAPEAEGLFASHFGINLSSLAAMSPEQLGQQTDMILQAKQFAEYLPLIEGHIKDYIKAVTDYNTFIARSVKEGAKGIKEIDKAKMDVMLEWFGYKAHQEQLGRKSDNEKIKIQAETENYIALSDFSLETALAIKAAALQKSMEDARQRPVLAAEQAEIRQLVNQRKQEVKQLIQYGTAGKR